MKKFHPLNAPTPGNGLFVNPFSSEPGELCRFAVHELQSHLPQLDEGKMFGVLLVEHYGQLGYLQAYSGQLEGAADDFVPAVVDYLQPDGYFKTHEAEISEMGAEISRIEQCADYRHAVNRLNTERSEADRLVEQKRFEMRSAKAQRDLRRNKITLSEHDRREMIRESQFMKAEVHRAVASRAARVGAAEQLVKQFEGQITELRRERKLKSDRLQQWLFSQFVFLNARGEKKSLIDIFSDYMLRNASSTRLSAGTLTPPSGAGECCEPKLLQYAFEHNMRPIEMTTFWWGDAPMTELRRHGQFYGACSGKCKPILDWMLRGLDVEPNPLEQASSGELAIVYEDAWITVVNKPSGMLSVPGRSNRESVYNLLRKRRPEEEPLVVHRLDMATSGLLVVARSLDVYRALQQQFACRSVEKTYTALLPLELLARPIPREGIIELPIRPDPLDRPRQVVDFAKGRPAVTHYIIKEKIHTSDRSHPLAVEVEFHPITGRTHQLRVHSAHPAGLGVPILGDALYGSPACRLYLHASRLSFVHPLTGVSLEFIANPRDVGNGM